MANMKNLEEVYLNHNSFIGKIQKPSKKKDAAQKPESNLCSLKKLKVLQADCARTRKHPAEIDCECCTVCCNDYADPKCIAMGDAAATKTKKKKAAKKTTATKK